MKPLFDQNLSPKLVELASDVFPYFARVSTVGLDRAEDPEIPDHVSQRGYAVVGKDADFADLAQVREELPKVVWLRLANCTTHEIEAAIRSRLEAIEALGDDASVLEF